MRKRFQVAELPNRVLHAHLLGSLAQIGAQLVEKLTPASSGDTPVQLPFHRPHSALEAKPVFLGQRPLVHGNASFGFTGTGLERIFWSAATRLCQASSMCVSSA